MVGGLVKEHRLRLGLTREQLAERCAELGANITASVLVNIESGRPDKQTGARRRDVTVDEWLILAFALDVPPLALLLKGLPDKPVLDLTPDLEVGPYGFDAINWITGEKPPADFDDERLKRWREGGLDLTAARLLTTYTNRLRELDHKQGSAAWMDVLRDLARLVDFWVMSGRRPPIADESHLRIMLGQGWLEHPEEVEAAFKARQAERERKREARDGQG